MPETVRSRKGSAAGSGVATTAPAQRGTPPEIPADPPLLAAALDAARRGWYVFPLHDVAGGKCSCGGQDGCKPGKHPRIKDWPNEATRVEATIRHWWKRWPTANIGGLCGPKSGRFATDWDGADGVAYRAELERQFGPLCPLERQQTGGGGLHDVWRWPVERVVRNPTRVGGKPYDLRGANGYIVLAPSVTDKGPYGRIDVAHGQAGGAMPAGMLELVVPPIPAGPPPEVAEPPPGHTDAVVAWQAFQAERRSRRPSPHRRAEAYLRTCERTVQGEDGDGRMLFFARVCVRGFLLSEAEALGLLMADHAGIADPPWARWEVAHKVREALCKPFDKPWGWLLYEERPRKSARPTIGRQHLSAPPARPPAARQTQVNGTALPGPPAPAAEGGGPVSDNGMARPSVRNATKRAEESLQRTAAALKAAETSKAAEGTPGPANGQADRQLHPQAHKVGRTLNASHVRTVGYFWEPWFPEEEFVLVAGADGTGKSSLFGELMRRSDKTLIFPGSEEGVETWTLPRVLALGIDPHKVRWMDDQEYRVKEHSDLIRDAAIAQCATLLLFDPLDDYFLPVDIDRDNTGVRDCIQRLQKIAREAHVLIAGVRHPGRKADNPLRGASAWRQTPRIIHQLSKDDSEPPVRIMQPLKYQGGEWPAPAYFRLVGPKGPPPRFEIGEPVARAEALLARSNLDEMGRFKIDRAVDLLRQLLATGKMEQRDVMAIAAGYKLGDDVMLRAARRLELAWEREGFGAGGKVYWWPPGQQPPPPTA